ncbi:ShlB/FhaC/HecB family hemolysin secretion/activation protein [Lyngbya aestuarii]|uniref:ShlB/FhaC/HecB family hemolysin secretion/activation protein n=1 Tax=Lyngbya aestuarii TaxID=118322 RepID=UPI00403DC11D
MNFYRLLLINSVVLALWPMAGVKAQLMLDQTGRTENYTASSGDQLLEETQELDLDIASFAESTSDTVFKENRVWLPANTAEDNTYYFVDSSFHFKLSDQSYATGQEIAREANSKAEQEEEKTEITRQENILNGEASTVPSVAETAVALPRRLRKIEAIEVTGTRRLTPKYIRSRLAVARETPLEEERLLNALNVLQLDPLIANLSVEWGAGSSADLSVLRVNIKEADAFSALVSTSNQGSTSVGTIRRQFQLTHGNLLGFGDRLSVSYSQSEGSKALDTISYAVPLNSLNATLSLSHGRANSNILEKPLDILDIESKSRQYQLTYRQPLRKTATEEFVLGLTASREEAQTIIGFNNIGPFPLYEGANRDGELKISALRFFQEYTKRSNRQVLALRSQFSLGLGAFAATINDDAPDSRFLTWHGKAEYLRLLAPDTILVLKSEMQLADQSLVSLEQFSLGGQSSVRGYRQSALQADNGFLVSAELRVPILRIPQLQTVVQLVPFVDFGTVWNSSDSSREMETHSVSSLGLGLRLPVANKFTARIDWGIPLVNLDSRGDSLQEQGIYFTIEYQPF